MRARQSKTDYLERRRGSRGIGAGPSEGGIVDRLVLHGMAAPRPRGTGYAFCALLTIVVLGLRLAPVWAAPSPPEVVTARLGISAGDAIQDLPRGTTGATLAARIPELAATAAALEVTVDSASVGQGFWSDDGQLGSEHDLDLVVTGQRAHINALGAMLGKAWAQSSVDVWYEGPDADQATATIPLPGGTDALTDAVYAQLIGELTDGGHVKYAGPDSLLFVANTGTDTATEFFARMDRAAALLAMAGVPTGPVARGTAELVVLDQANYDTYINLGDPSAHGKAA